MVGERGRRSDRRVIGLQGGVEGVRKESDRVVK